MKYIIIYFHDGFLHVCKHHFDSHEIANQKCFEYVRQINEEEGLPKIPSLPMVLELSKFKNNF